MFFGWKKKIDNKTDGLQVNVIFFGIGCNRSLMGKRGCHTPHIIECISNFLLFCIFLFSKSFLNVLLRKKMGPDNEVVGNLAVYETSPSSGFG